MTALQSPEYSKTPQDVATPRKDGTRAALTCSGMSPIAYTDPRSLHNETLLRFRAGQSTNSLTPKNPYADLLTFFLRPWCRAPIMTILSKEPHSKRVITTTPLASSDMHTPRESSQRSFDWHGARCFLDDPRRRDLSIPGLERSEGRPWPRTSKPLRAEPQQSLSATP